MKKALALLLAVAMMLTCCFVFVGCDTQEKPKEKTAEDKVKDAVQAELAVTMIVSTLGGAEISFVSCTYGTIKPLSNGDYKVSGTVRVRDAYGNFHVANYDADVEYDAEDDDYSADAELGSFKKQ